jgi:hypothetical protein
MFQITYVIKKLTIFLYSYSSSLWEYCKNCDWIESTTVERYTKG